MALPVSRLDLLWRRVTVAAAFAEIGGELVERTPTSVHGLSAGGGLGRAAGVTPHDLPHTTASLAVAAGANVKAVQRMLGARLGRDDLGRVRGSVR